MCVFVHPSCLFSHFWSWPSVTQWDYVCCVGLLTSTYAHRRTHTQAHTHNNISLECFNTTARCGTYNTFGYIASGYLLYFLLTNFLLTNHFWKGSSFSTILLFVLIDPDHPLWWVRFSFWSRNFFFFLTDFSFFLLLTALSNLKQHSFGWKIVSLKEFRCFWWREVCFLLNRGTAGS